MRIDAILFLPSPSGREMPFPINLDQCFSRSEKSLSHRLLPFEGKVKLVFFS